MSLNPLTRNLSYFEKHRELPGVQKQPFTQQHRDGILDLVDCDFRLAQQKDNGSEDLDPGQGRLLMKWPNGGITSATFSEDKTGRHLERTTVMGGGRSVTHIHQAVEGLDYLACYSFPGEPDTMTCYHADFARPENDFWQTSSAPAPPAAGPFPNCNRLGLR